MTNADDKKPPQSERLVTLARDMYRFGQSTSGDPFALPIDGVPIARMFRGGRDGLRARMSAAFLDAEGRPPTANALADALGALEGVALREDPTELHLRVARHNGRIVIDLGHEDGTAAVIGPDGWHLTADAGVIFRRTQLTGRCPNPSEVEPWTCSGTWSTSTVTTWPCLSRGPCPFWSPTFRIPSSC
jgi:hypothetical protein